MPDYLAKIKEIIEEHHTVRENVKRVGESVSDQEALDSLKSTRSGWAPGKLDIIAEKQSRLQETVNFLREGMLAHFIKEEEFLPAVLGDFLMRGLLIEHKEMNELLSRALEMARDTNLQGLSPEALTDRDNEIKTLINHLCEVIENHADKEDSMLDMVEKAL